jgi:DNA-binding transcriptional MerR regulator
LLANITAVTDNTSYVFGNNPQDKKGALLHPLRQLRAASTISQMRREFGVTARALRYYEEKGLLSPVRSHQVRVYSHRDRVRLKLVLKGRRAGFSLSAIRELLDVYDKEGEIAQLAKALPRFKAQVAALEARRRQLDDAIETLKAASLRLSQSGRAVEQQSQRQA